MHTKINIYYTFDFPEKITEKKENQKNAHILIFMTHEDKYLLYIGFSPKIRHFTVILF